MTDMRAGRPDQSQSSGQGRDQRRRRGYTLLEVLIALSILATALTVLVGTLGVSKQQAFFAQDLNTASQLARAKMIDLEYELMRDGFSNSVRRSNGDFSREGHPGMTWEATVQPVEIPEEAREALLAKVNEQLFGGVSGDGALQGNAAFSSMLPTLIGQMPNLINRVGQKIRRIDLRVEFPFGAGTYPLVLTQYVVDQESAQFELFTPGALP